MITVSQLIEQLKELPQDAPVYVYADHGETHEQSSGASVEYVEELSFFAETAWDEEGNEQDKSKHQIVTIG